MKTFQTVSLRYISLTSSIFSTKGTDRSKSLGVLYNNLLAQSMYSWHSWRKLITCTMEDILEGWIFWTTKKTEMHWDAVIALTGARDHYHCLPLLLSDTRRHARPSPPMGTATECVIQAYKKTSADKHSLALVLKTAR